MMDVDEDEDVVFEGSAIHQHLQSMGYSDYETAQPLPSNQGKSSSSQGRKFKIDWLLLKEKLSSLITFLLWPKKLRRSFYWRTFKNIYDSRLLISDDQLLLKHFVPHILIPPNKLADSSIISGVCLWCLRGLLFSTAVTLGLFMVIGEPSSWSSIFLTSAFTFAVWIATISLLLCRSSASIEKFIEVLQGGSYLFSKSLRLLLEEDLVARGFVLAQGSSSFPSRDRREAPHTEGLRKSLHSSLYAMLPVLSSSHEHLKTFASYYPCVRGLFDDFEEINDEQQQDVTEHLKFLKKLVTLVKLQMSAVMSELILCADDVEVLECLLNNSRIFSSPLVGQIRKETDLLAKHLTYAQSFWVNNAEEIRETSCEEKKNNVFLAIHSLSLHMQAALFRIQDLEKKFDHVEFTSGDPNEGENLEDLPSYEFVRHEMDSIQIELQSCQGCLDETLARVDRKYSIKEDVKADSDTPVNKMEEITSAMTVKKAPIPLFDLEEPVAQDEVFEAYVDQEYVNNRDKEFNDDFWSADAKQERKKLKQQKEQGKRVLHELQPLLHKLREVWDERETAALERQKGDIEKALYGNDPSHHKRGQLNEDQAGIPTKKTDIKISNTNMDGGISNGENYHRKAADDLEGMQSLKLCINDSVVAMSDNYQSVNQSSKLDDFEDSDDERLEVYRKVRKELEQSDLNIEADPPEDRDSDDERLEVYRKVRKELEMDGKSSAPETIDRDSDDERLDIYRRVKMELDKEETEEKSKSSSSSLCNMKEQANGKLCLPSVSGVGLVSLHSVGESGGTFDNSVLQTKNERNLSFQTLFESSKPKKDRVDATSALSEGKVNSKSNVKCNHVSSPSSESLKEEIFAYGSDSDNDGCESPRIDWSTVTLPTQLTDTLEDCMQLYCGGLNRGFHADLAAEAQLASREFLLNRNDNMQTFRGVGESEEVFGSEDEEESE